MQFGRYHGRRFGNWAHSDYLTKCCGWLGFPVPKLESFVFSLLGGRKGLYEVVLAVAEVNGYGKNDKALTVLEYNLEL